MRVPQVFRHKLDAQELEELTKSVELALFERLDQVAYFKKTGRRETPAERRSRFALLSLLGMFDELAAKQKDGAIVTFTVIERKRK